MTTSKYHTREGYESLLRMICKETGEKIPYNILSMSDFDLKSEINQRLNEFNCLPFTWIEFRKKIS